MSDWRLLAIALAFVGWMASLQRVNHRAMKLGALLVLGLAGYKTVPMLAAGLAGREGPAEYSGADSLGPGPGPSGGGVLSIFRRGGGTTPAATPGAPNAPVIDVTVVDTSTVRLTIQEPVFSGADTHESSDWAIDRVAGNWSAPILSSIADTDSLEALTFSGATANDSLKADSTYKARVRVTGAAGGASEYDTIVFVNTVGAVSVWSSDWVGAADWTDDGLWASISGVPGNFVSVATGSALSSGTQINMSGLTDPVFAMAMADPPTPPGIGDAITFRFYFMLVVPDAFTDDGDLHPIGWGNNGGSITASAWPVGWTFYPNINGPANTFALGLMINADGFGLRRFTTSRNAHESGTVGDLNKSEWYRFENTFTRLSADTWSVDVAIYDDEDALVLDTDDFDSTPGENPGNPDPIMADAVLEADADVLMEFVIGSNGITSWNDGDFYRQGQVAAAYDTLVGPYPIIEEN